MTRPRVALSFCAMAAVFNLNHHATFVHFHIGGGSTPFFVFDMSLSNVLVIAATLVVLAILLPFPHHQGAGSQQ
jgi:hypothetical protein